MLKKCSEQDRKRLTDYLYQNPVLNLFIIGDLYNYGFDSDIQDLYIDEDYQGIHGLVLRYRNTAFWCKAMKVGFILNLSQS